MLRVGESKLHKYTPDICVTIGESERDSDRLHQQYQTHAERSSPTNTRCKNITIKFNRKQFGYHAPRTVYMYNTQADLDVKAIKSHPSRAMQFSQCTTVVSRMKAFVYWQLVLQPDF